MKKLLSLLIILFLLTHCFNDKTFDKQMKQSNILLLLMLQSSDSTLASAEKERKNNPIPDSQFLGDWSFFKYGKYLAGTYTYRNYYSLEFKR